MKYIAYKNFKGEAMCGEIHIFKMSVCECVNNIIRYKGNNICLATSETAHRFFAIDEDGMGMVRGGLIQTIQTILSQHDDHYQDRWDKVWEDKNCLRYKHKYHKDFWLWNHEFFNADISVLKYILNLINIKST